MSVSKSLERLAVVADYPSPARPRVRWGQLIRESVSLGEETTALRAAGRMTALDELGELKSGVVTRANGYFLVRELAFEKIPDRLRVTRRDLQRIAVVVDGLGYVERIERRFLRPVIKGPESLISAFRVRPTDLRLFDVSEDKDALRRSHADGALRYLRRGETVDYRTSQDDLKGGIPARRAQVKNRRPYWYSLNVNQRQTDRIAFPEHLDRRYVFTLIGHGDPSVVIDTLYLFEPYAAENAAAIHAALNTLSTWYQVELRGRSQHGEGVLKVKIPDYNGITLLNPTALDREQCRRILDAFAHVLDPGSGHSLDELSNPARRAFDLTYLELCGFTDPEASYQRFEQELRALAGERSERRLSVTEAKVSRRKITNVAASIDAYATRVAALLPPHPDPRVFVPEGVRMDVVPVLADPAGSLEVGTELFNHGEVLAGGMCVVRTGSSFAAQFVRGVLLVQPELSSIEVPVQPALESIVTKWNEESRQWHWRFQAASNRTLTGLDSRTKLIIEQRALKLLHAI
jgi:hypothetical protein